MRGDADLLEAWRQGDQSAGSQLFERHYPAIARFFANKTASDPADLIQETFEACVKGRDRLRNSTGFTPYLFGIAYNVLRRHYEQHRKRQARFDPDHQSVADLSPGPGTMVARRDEHRLLLLALRRIPLHHQVVLELFYWEGMTSATISQVLNVPDGTIRSRLRKARQQLHTAVGELVVDPTKLDYSVDDIETWASQIRQDHQLPPES